MEKSCKKLFNKKRQKARETHHEKQRILKSQKVKNEGSEALLGEPQAVCSGLTGQIQRGKEGKKGVLERQRERGAC